MPGVAMTTITIIYGWRCYGKRGCIDWGNGQEYDTVQCYHLYFIPLLPIKIVHIFARPNYSPGEIPLRWSWDFGWRAMMAPWLWALAAFGFVFFGLAAINLVFLGLAAINHWHGQRGLDLDPTTLLISAGFFGIAALGWWYFADADRRHKDLRLLLGPEANGDPATWLSDRLRHVHTPQDFGGMETYAEAVSRLLETGDYSQAMWAARYAAAIGDRELGETLTDLILEHPDVQSVLRSVRREPKRWAELLGTKGQTA
jgi:hypothetical protein